MGVWRRMKKELSDLKRETKQKELLKPSCGERIFYTKNMAREFAVLAVKRKKKLVKMKLVKKKLVKMRLKEQKQ